MKGIADLMRQAQEMQSKMTALQEELGTQEVTGQSGGGIVRAVANGRQELLSVSIEKTAVDPEDIGMLEDLVCAAVNDALNKAKELAAQNMASLTGGFKIPGLM